MTPKNKAKELITKFRKHAMYWDCYNDEPLDTNHAKLCALICVDELINVTLVDDIPRKRTPRDKQYWQQVKQELEKL